MDIVATAKNTSSSSSSSAIIPEIKIGTDANQNTVFYMTPVAMGLLVLSIAAFLWKMRGRIFATTTTNNDATSGEEQQLQQQGWWWRRRQPV
jgi:hypothetical protein